eukprot:880477-Amphidinium_carterae.2
MVTAPPGFHCFSRALQRSCTVSHRLAKLGGTPPRKVPGKLPAKYVTKSPASPTGLKQSFLRE